MESALSVEARARRGDTTPVNVTYLRVTVTTAYGSHDYFVDQATANGIVRAFGDTDWFNGVDWVRITVVRQ